jgi:HEAT repeat protein
MNRAEAIQILQRHQPLPPDTSLSEEVITDFDAARRYFVAHPDPDAVPLFLNAFGDGSGFGVYQLVEDAIRPLPPATVLPHLIDALQSSRPSKRYWAAQIAVNFPDPALIPVLAPLLFSADSDFRAAAATALMFIKAPEVPGMIREAHSRTGDPFLQELIDDLG